MKILVTGATGVLGRHVVEVLRARGHDVAAGARHPGRGDILLDLLDPDSVARACTGVAVVAHCAADPFGRAADVEVGGIRLVRAATAARIVYPSIVGCDHIRFKYYRVKRDAEAALTGDHAIVRLTQFHEFAERLARLPVPMVFAGMRAQTLAARDAAEIVADAVVSKQQGMLGDFGGPEVHRMKDLVREVVRADGRRRPVLALPVGWRGFRAGYNLTPNKAGHTTWRAYRDAAATVAR